MRIVQTDKAPQAIGAYSQAVEVQGVLYCSGQIPIIPETREVILDDIEKATQQVFNNIYAILIEAGLEKNNIIKMTVYLADMNSFDIMNSVYKKNLGNHRPARVVVEVLRLPKDVAIEIDCLAVRE